MSTLRRTIRPLPRETAGRAARADRGGGLPGERFLLFHSGGEPYGIAVAFLLEVALPEGIWVIAGGEGQECVVFSHRGFTVPALDLRVVLRSPARPPAEAGRVLVGEAAGQRFGLLVDRVGDVVEFAPHEILALPEGASRLPSACFRGIVRREDRVVLLLEAAGLGALECIARVGNVVAVPWAGAV